MDDANSYSLEQAKQKSENDKMIAIAESKKQEMRQKITELRKKFKELLVKNEQLVPRIKLGKDVINNLKFWLCLHIKSTNNFL